MPLRFVSGAKGTSMVSDQWTCKGWNHAASLSKAKSHVPLRLNHSGRDKSGLGYACTPVNGTDLLVCRENVVVRGAALSFYCGRCISTELTGRQERCRRPG